MFIVQEEYSNSPSFVVDCVVIVLLLMLAVFTVVMLIWLKCAVKEVDLKCGLNRLALDTNFTESLREAADHFVVKVSTFYFKQKII